MPSRPPRTATHPEQEPAGLADTTAPDDTTAPPADEKQSPPPSVVPSSELRSHTPDGPTADVTDIPVGTTPAGASDDDGLVAEHWHEPSNGPENTPAGAHRHTPDGPAHVHVVGDRRIVDDVRPAPWSDTNPPPEADAETATVTADRDCTISINGQLVELRKGEKVTGRRGKFLADTGAPVTAA